MRRTLLAVSLLAAAAAVWAVPAMAAEGPWEAIAALRQRLEHASPLAADFEQTFVATGFATGDSESGRLFVDLPACLRWDYEGDFPNSFLLCGHLAHGWNEGEASGRRRFLSRGDEPGLDLLRLEVEELKKRYRARFVERDGDLLAIELTATAAATTEVRDATLWFAAGEAGLRTLAYHDLEGNLTRFEFGEYRPLADRAVFSPPVGMEWIHD